MALVFKVGEHSDFPPVPKKFPQCGDYIPDETSDSNVNYYENVNVKRPVISFSQWWPLDYFNGTSTGSTRVIGVYTIIFAFCITFLMNV